MSARDRDSSELRLDESLGNQLPVVNPDAYRKTMARFTLDAVQMISSILAEADFKSSFPQVFGHPDDVGAEVTIRNHCGPLLQKALLHTKAALAANQVNNLHSVAVQSRVVLECGAHVLSMAHGAAKGTSQELNRLINTTEYEMVNTLRSLSRGTFDADDLQAKILRGRQKIGVHGKGRPRRVTIRDKLNYLPDGAEWYDFLSENFCKCDPKTLAHTSLLGGVIQPPKDAESFAFGFFLDYLAGLLLQMLVGYSFLVIGADGDSQLFDDALALLERKRKAARSFRSAGQPNSLRLDRADSVP